MKFRFWFFMFLFLPIFAMATEIEWIKVGENPEVGLTIFIDKDGMVQEEYKDKKFAGVPVLFHTNSEVKIEYGRGKKSVTDIVRWMFIDCSRALTFPIKEFFFKLDHLPKESDVSIGSVKYRLPTPKPIATDNPVFLVACPSEPV